MEEVAKHALGETATHSDLWPELFGLAGTFLWVLLVAGIFWSLKGTIIQTVLPRLDEMSAFGIELSFIEKAMGEAADRAGSENKVIVEKTVKTGLDITRRDRERAVERGRRCEALLRGKRILWIDDEITNNRIERTMLECFGLTIEQVQSNDAALKALAVGGHDLILSDISRGKDENGNNNPNGLEFLESYRKGSDPLPVILYVSVLDEDQPIPNGAFGLTNRPDDLLHLVIDALERRA